MDKVAYLEVHYYLKDESHAMNAFVRNRCEADFLNAVSHIIKAFGVEFCFEATVPGEGGFREKWRIYAAHPLAVSLLTLLLNQAIEIWKAAPAPNLELEKQQIEINKLTAEHLKLENRLSELQIQKLEKEKADISQPSAPLATSGVLPASRPIATGGSEKRLSELSGVTVFDGPESREKPIQLQLDAKVVTPRSDFYKQLITYENVTAVGFRAIPPAGPVASESVVERSQFRMFIMQPNTLEPDVSEAQIEIVSPVIIEGDMKWKGRRNGEVISFAMSDRAFKQQVLSKELSFQHGDSIRCILEIDRKLDETGAEKITGYRVTTVLDKIDGNGNAHETPQGRRKRFTDKQPKDGQSDLFGKASV
ncbi:hypothetical protein [Paraburkholderia caribensis]|uniref:hypothetical protein n=1 Tax=Paraburkholderia caribensis TaxID=75105 RepID=UPI00078B6198|nr:hypothetical protein [Paraburkholderia caribensis]AMV41344.1 hypothetical protein ATN79_01435 [Paraburkholderia caribensis]